MVETIELLEKGELESRVQDHEEATFAPRMTREMGRVDWALTASELFNRLRAYVPWPGLHAELRGDPVKILAATSLPQIGCSGREPGEVLGLVGEDLHVACGKDSVLVISRLQRSGKPARSAREFVNGERLEVGDRFV